MSHAQCYLPLDILPCLQHRATTPLYFWTPNWSTHIRHQVERPKPELVASLLENTHTCRNLLSQVRLLASPDHGTGRSIAVGDRMYVCKSGWELLYQLVNRDNTHYFGCRFYISFGMPHPGRLIRVSYLGCGIYRAGGDARGFINYALRSTLDSATFGLPELRYELSLSQGWLEDHYLWKYMVGRKTFCINCWEGFSVTWWWKVWTSV